MSSVWRVSILVMLSGVLCFAVGLAGSSSNIQQSQGVETARYVAGEVLIKFKSTAEPIDMASARAEVNAVRLWTFHSGGEHWRLGPGLDVEAAISRLKGNGLVEYAEPNYIVSLAVIPNDPRFGEMWHFVNTGQAGGTPDADIDADGAWGIATGSSDIVVGVIDSGVDYNHPDLAGNIWTNTGEIAGNGLDDDANGYVDDVHGYDFVNEDGAPNDQNGHGTHVSGTIGAVGDNGIGVTGVNWQVKIMALKAFGWDGNGTFANIVRAIDYSVMMGVALTNNSYGGYDSSSELSNAISHANSHDMAFIAAAGNDGWNIDLYPFYPACYTYGNIITVAATTNVDTKASFSNWSATSVDLGAPGVGILSTWLGDSYLAKDGTSMATPQVSGVAALMLANTPGLPVSELKNRILNTVDYLPALDGITVSKGRLNALFALSGSLVSSEYTTVGSKTLDYKATYTANDVRERLVEGIKFVKPDHYYVQLDHTWRFLNVPAGSSHMLHVEGYRPDNPTNTNFQFSYSTDGTSFYPITDAIISSSIETEGGADYPFNSSGMSGTIYIKVRDTTPRLEDGWEDVYIDHLTIKTVP